MCEVECNAFRAVECIGIETANSYNCLWIKTSNSFVDDELNLYKRKNTAYGGAWLACGCAGVAARIWEKIWRVYNISILKSDNPVVGESVEGTIHDIFVQAAMGKSFAVDAPEKAIISIMEEYRNKFIKSDKDIEYFLKKFKLFVDFYRFSNVVRNQLGFFTLCEELMDYSLYNTVKNNLLTNCYLDTVDYSNAEFFEVFKKKRLNL
jgi:hypothetical protein